MAQQGYIGRNPGDGRTIVNRQTSHVTTGVQTSFTMTVGYEIGYLDVYLNGIKQTETLDYTASDGSTINFGLSFPPVNGDVLEFVAFETLNITNIKSARRNFSVGQDLDVSGKVTIGSSLTVASDLVVNGTFTTINTEILDVEDKTVGIASTSSPSNTTADGAGIVIYGGSDGDKSITWNTDKSNFVLVGGGVSIGTGVTISTPAANVLAFSVNSAEKARFNNFGAFTVGYEGEAWHESTYVGVLQAGSGAWIGQTPGASARAEWVNNAYYDSVNTRWEYIAADEANRIVLENGELKLQSADAGSADGAITWNEKLKMTVGGDFKIGAPTGIGITISSSGNVDSIGIVTASSFVGNGANLTSLNASNIGSGTVPTARLGSGTASSSTFLRGDSTFAVVNTDLVADTSPQLGGDLQSNGNDIDFADADKAVFGTGSDFSIYHDGSNSIQFFDAQVGAVRFRTDIGNSARSNLILGAGVDLYYNGTKMFETTADGATLQKGLTVRGIEGAEAQIRIEADEADNASDRFRLVATDSAGFFIQSYDGSQYDNLFGGYLNGSSELYHNHVKKFETLSSGARVLSASFATLEVKATSNDAVLKLVSNNDEDTDWTIHNDYSESNDFDVRFNNSRKMNLDTSGNLFIAGNLDLEDGDKVLLGSGDDLQLYHSSGTNYADIASGQQLYFRVGGSNKFYVQSGGAQFVGSLYGDDDNKIELGNSQDLKIYHDSSANKTKIETVAGGNLDIGSTHNADVQIKTNSVNRFNFGAGGFAPLADNTYELGTSSLRWSNIYTADLHCSNKGSSNDVDGTWGDYTIQEGESDLFLINNRNGKKYKFNLTEVS